MATSSTSSRNSGVRSDSQAMTAAPVRPSRCPSRPCTPARSTNPVSHGSTRTHRPVPAQYSHLGFPRRVSSIPSTRGRFRLGQHSFGVRDERAVRGRPRHAMSGGDLGHRARRVTDRGADLGAQPLRGARPRRHLRDGLGERGPLAVVLPASPASLVPPHDDSFLTVGDVFR